MAGTGELEVIIASSKLVEGCKRNGCIYAHTREGYAEKEAPWDCRVEYEDHVVQNFEGDGCHSAAINNPSQNPDEIGTVIPGTMTENGFTKHDSQAPSSWEAHRVKVFGFSFSPSPTPLE